MLGRATPSPQLDSAARYIRSRLAEMRIQPAGDNGDYAQPITFGVTDFAACSSAALRGITYHWPEDIRSGGPNDTAEVDLHGQVIYAGDGWVSKSLGLDPYAGLDLRGKIALLSPRPNAPSRGRASNDLTAPPSAAAARGAVAILVLPEPGPIDSAQDQFLGPMPRLRDSLRVGAAVATASWLPSRSPLPIPRFVISSRLADSLRMSNAQSDLAVRKCRGASRVAAMQNVLAVVPGSDPAHKDEYVIIGAHYDGQGLHLPPVRGDSINNSALDNATGSAALLEIAKALAAGPRPRRSVVLAWFGGEEMTIGRQFGSAYFVAHPTITLSSIKLMINLDEVGPEAENKGVIDVGYSDPTLRDFVAAHSAACPSTPLHPAPNGQLAGGSDRDNFARVSIPYLAFEADAGDDHSVTDEPRKIQYGAFADVVRCIYRLTWSLSALPRFPPH
jgi:hypothetical protein